MSDQWQEARTLQGFGSCLAAWHLRQLGDMPVALNKSRNRISFEAEASVMARVSGNGYFLVYDVAVGIGAEELALASRAMVHAFVPSSLIGPVRQALQVEGLYCSAHAPGSPNQEATYAVERRNGKESGRGDWVFGPKEIEENFVGLHPRMIEELKSAWQVFAADTMWNRNSYLWTVLGDLV